MALKLNGTSGYLQYPNKVASTYPFSMMLWVNTPYTGVAQQFINQAQSTAARSSSGWLDANGATVYAQTGVPDGSSGAAQLSPTLSTSSLKLMLVVFVSASTRRVYYNSSTPGVQTYGSVDDSINYDVTTIGAIQTNNIAATGFAVASIAEAHFFNVALTDTDYTTLAGGALPETVSGWVDGWSLQTYSAGGTYSSIGGSRTLTAYGGVIQSSTAHPITRTPPATFSGSITLDNAVAAGAFSSIASSLTGNVTLDDAVAAGVFGVAPGVLTITGIKNNTGSLLAGITLPNVVVIRRSDRAALLALTAQVINGSGALVIPSTALIPGTACQVVAFENDGSLGGCWPATAV